MELMKAKELMVFQYFPILSSDIFWIMLESKSITLLNTPFH